MEVVLFGVGKIFVSFVGEFFMKVGLFGIGEVKVSNDEGVFLVLGIGKIIVKVKNSLEFCKKLKDYLEL